MPRATISATETHRYDLKTCPGGFVELRALTYQEMLHRQDGSSKMFMDARRRTSKRNDQGVERVAVDIMQQWTREYEFSHCVVDHNLEDDTGNKLDFKNKHTFEVLNPKIGEEIETLIDDLNQIGDEEDTEDVAGDNGSPPPMTQTDDSST
jgi:hypothetical protein